MKQYIIPFEPGWKVLELGGGEHPYFRPNADCRPLPTVDMVFNFEQRFPIDDESYDAVFAKYVIEHISWRKTKHFVSEIHRILKPNGVAVLIAPNTLEQCKEIARRNRIGIEENALLFGGQDFPDNFHKAAFSPEYVKQLFTAVGFKHVEVFPLPGCHTDMIIEAYKGYKSRPFSHITGSKWFRELKEQLRSNPPKFKDEDLKMLNIGSYTVMLPPPFENLDILDLSDYARKHGYLFRQVDVREGLPYASNSVKFINVSHLLEHLEPEEAKYFLSECYRVLCHNGKVRIGVPDLRKLVEAYLHGDMDKFNKHQPEKYRNAKTQAEKFWLILTSNHKTCYDYEALEQLLSEVGFEVRQVEYDERYDMYPDHSIYVEGIKCTQ